MKILSLPLVTILLSLAHPMHAAADSNEGMPADIGASVRMNALGTYDVGKELGGGALRNDLGPATLGFEVFAGIRPTNKLRIAG